MKTIQRVLGCIALFIAFIAAPVARSGEIHEAALAGDLLKVWSLLKDHPRLVESVTADDRSTPLHEAVRGGRIEVVRALIASKADVNAKTARGLTPLKWAKGHGKTEIASFLEESGGLLLEPAPKPRSWTFILPDPQRVPSWRLFA